MKSIICFSILAGRQIGLFIGPCFTLAFKQIDFYMGELHVSLHNFPGMFMAILWIIIWILTLFLFFDAGKAAVNINDNEDDFLSYSMFVLYYRLQINHFWTVGIKKH